MIATYTRFERFINRIWSHISYIEVRNEDIDEMSRIWQQTYMPNGYDVTEIQVEHAGFWSDRESVFKFRVYKPLMKGDTRTIEEKIADYKKEDRKKTLNKILTKK